MRCIQGFSKVTWGKRPLGRPRHGWEDKMDLQEGDGGGTASIDLAEDTDRWWGLVNTVMNLQVA